MTPHRPLPFLTSTLALGATYLVECVKKVASNVEDLSRHEGQGEVQELTREIPVSQKSIAVLLQTFDFVDNNDEDKFNVHDEYTC